MLAAASIKVMDALFGFLAQNDAEWTKRELLGRTWRRDWAMRRFHQKKVFLHRCKDFCTLDALGNFNDEKRSDFGLGSAFFGISDPGLVKKGFFETFLSQKIDGRSRG